MPEFTHLHVHTQYSLLDGAARIDSLMENVKNNGMKSLAITDHGNMFGVPKFVSEAKKKGILPVIGCEFYLAHGSRHDKTKREDVEEKNIYHQLILAKNEIGYKNLSQLSSQAYIEGYYYKPRIDKELIRKHKEGLIATTCCLASEINQTILHRGEKDAEKLFVEWLEIFGEDYYIEIQRHGIKEQDICNEVLLRWSKKYNVKVIATNDVHYVNMKDSEAQDILLCLQTGKDYDDPARMRFQNNQFYLKTKEEMEVLFKDVPESLDNTAEIISKIEPLKLERSILLPFFPLPESFQSMDDYLKFLSYEGARKKYGELTETLIQRLDFELSVIKDMGFAGYFLIVQDFIAVAKTLKVSVGPGRGSAAGSVVAYCTDITNIDPIKYDLLFERFLNPERVSMPDIDIDFDDIGREKVINYVIDKYGKDKVAQIVTFGTMAAKSAIKDVSRVLKLPLNEANRIVKLIPDGLNVSLKKAFDDVKELSDLKINNGQLQSKVLNFAEVLEGSPRHTGIHAAGVIIAPDNLLNFIPVCTSKDSELLITQYDGKYVESVGMLKMDFLGLKTLTIIVDAVELIEQNHGVKIDIDNIPLDDKKALDLYQRGDTIGTFQFESDGMRQYLKDLKPTNIEDLIAMNALYRPGPMDFIPKFIACKHGREKVEYPHPILEGILKNTYGIMVYQEQIMQTAQIMGGFTLGGADLLRRAMGKKDMAKMDEQKAIFVEGAKNKGIDEKKAEEVYAVMAKFAEYGFNRSHSAAYSVLAYQTGYLKAHYPNEFMSAVLTNSMSDIKKVAYYMEESRRQKIAVLGPDINESKFKFTVNKSGAIRFGLGAIKGVGEGAVNAIVEEREKNGYYENIFDLVKRVNLKSVNKKTLEGLALAGAFDSFPDYNRKEYFHFNENETMSGIEKIIKFGSSFQEGKISNTMSLFGDVIDNGLEEPKLPRTENWGKLEILKYEKEIIGIYISGHPLDEYRLEIDTFCNMTIEELSDLESKRGKEFSIAGIITDAQHKVTKTNRPFGSFTIEDYTQSINIAMFSEDYLKNKHLLVKDTFLYVKGKVQQRFGDSNQLEVKVTSIQLLPELREKMVKSFSFKIGLEQLNNEVVKKLTALTKKYPGKTQLKVLVTDTSQKQFIELPATKLRVNPTNLFIDELLEITESDYKVN
ncbi:MAG: DNA polymerase III subunit alpha [Bacteroidota bacterium]